MSAVQSNVGVSPVTKGFIAQLSKALSAAAVLAASPATLGSSAATVNAGSFSRTITISLTAADGTLHDWFDGTFAIAASKTSTSGVVAIAGGGSTATFVNGVATVTLNYTGTWAAADTCTLTITGGTLLGFTVANKTSVDTLVA